MAQKNLEDAMASIRSEVTELRSMHDDAIQEKQEAISKLAVLTQYFEEKEAQLTKYVFQDMLMYSTYSYLSV